MMMVRLVDGVSGMMGEQMNGWLESPAWWMGRWMVKLKDGESGRLDGWIVSQA